MRHIIYQSTHPFKCVNRHDVPLRSAVPLTDEQRNRIENQAEKLGSRFVSK